MFHSNHDVVCVSSYVGSYYNTTLTKCASFITSNIWRISFMSVTSTYYVPFHRRQLYFKIKINSYIYIKIYPVILICYWLCRTCSNFFSHLFIFDSISDSVEYRISYLYKYLGLVQLYAAINGWALCFTPINSNLMSFIGVLSSTSTLWNVCITPHSISIFFHKSPNKLIKIKEPDLENDRNSIPRIDWLYDYQI